MPRYEYDPSHNPDDTSTFEPVPRNRTIGALWQLNQAKAKKPERIITVRRLLSEADARRLGTITQAALAASGRVTSSANRGVGYGISQLSAYMVGLAYERYFAPRYLKEPRQGQVDINEHIKEFLKTDSTRNTSTSAYLGDIIVVGRATPHVAAVLAESAPLSVEELIDEKYRLLHHITGDPDFSYRNAYDTPTPTHVSLASFYDRSSAEIFRRTFIRQDASIFADPVHVEPPAGMLSANFQTLRSPRP